MKKDIKNEKKITTEPKLVDPGTGELSYAWVLWCMDTYNTSFGEAIQRGESRMAIAPPKRKFV